MRCVSISKLICVSWTGVAIVAFVASADLTAAPEMSWKAGGRGGAVAGGGSEAVAAGISVLRADCNAADAAAATLLALAVTDYGQYAMSGEVALLLYDTKSGKVKSLCGLGRAPLDPEAIEW